MHQTLTPSASRNDATRLAPIARERAATHLRQASVDGYRKLLRGERALLRGHLLRLTPDDRCMRFCGTVSDSHIERYCAANDGLYRIALGYWESGVLRGAGELVFLSAPTWLGSAELSLSVERPFQNRGIGSELARRLLILARNRGAASVALLCLRENRRMQRLAAKFDAELRFAGSEVAATLTHRWPTPASVLEECWTDSLAIVGFVLGAPARANAKRTQSLLEEA